MKTQPVSLIDGEFIPEIQYLVFRKSTSNWQIKAHIVNNYNLTYVVKGRARYSINGADYEVTAGDMIYTEEGDLTSARTYPDNLMECFSINFSIRGGCEKGFPFPPVNHITLHRDIINLFHELIYIYFSREAGYKIKTRGIFFLIFYRFCELVLYKNEPQVRDYRIKKIIRYISKHYAKKISVQNMARMTGLNVVYLGALFKKETGISLKRYVIQTRVRNAENLLRSGEYTVTEAAELCGYMDTFHFYKQFKQIMGNAPSHYIPKLGGNRADAKNAETLVPA